MRRGLIHMPAELYEALRLQSYREHRSMAAIIRRAVERELALAGVPVAAGRVRDREDRE